DWQRLSRGFVVVAVAPGTAYVPAAACGRQPAVPEARNLGAWRGLRGSLTRLRGLGRRDRGCRGLGWRSLGWRGACSGGGREGRSCWGVRWGRGGCEPWYPRGRRGLRGGGLGGGGKG